MSTPIAQRPLSQLLAERDLYEHELATDRNTLSRRLAEFYIALIDGEIVRRSGQAVAS